MATDKTDRQRPREEDVDAERTDTTDQTDRSTEAGNPPHTTTGPLTAPKFGAAGSGGLEYEPGPEKD